MVQMHRKYVVYPSFPVFYFRVPCLTQRLREKHIHLNSYIYQTTIRL